MAEICYCGKLCEFATTVGFDISSPVVKLQQAFPTYCCCYWHSSRSNKGRVFVLLQIFLDDGGFYHHTRRKGSVVLGSFCDGSPFIRQFVML
ncbi:hypothetical protein MTR_7g056237 [Medicago truncatula]|uniref:Uncharacterized protein n=1 Tax=Medicago truncatula TaxID=3880 RepID=A0A072U0H5_MEDTR|nr:hypothetical protein MTR_7g056237 [Medicago truncatula]